MAGKKGKETKEGLSDLDDIAQEEYETEATPKNTSDKNDKADTIEGINKSISGINKALAEYNRLFHISKGKHNYLLGKVTEFKQDYLKNKKKVAETLAEHNALLHGTPIAPGQPSNSNQKSLVEYRMRDNYGFDMENVLNPTTVDNYRQGLMTFETKRYEKFESAGKISLYQLVEQSDETIKPELLSIKDLKGKPGEKVSGLVLSVEGDKSGIDKLVFVYITKDNYQIPVTIVPNEKVVKARNKGGVATTETLFGLPDILIPSEEYGVTNLGIGLLYNKKPENLNDINEGE